MHQVQMFHISPISIHAAQEGCDLLPNKKAPTINFNPRSPRGLRLWSAPYACKLPDFNPRSPRGLRPTEIIMRRYLKNISIHAAQEGCDADELVRRMTPAFQSTQPKRAATKQQWSSACGQCLFQSTQPKRAATLKAAELYGKTIDFNPRSPRGLRPFCIVT